HQPTLSRSKSMSTGSDKSLSPSPSSHLEKSEIEKLLQSGLADFSLRELLGAMLSNLAQAERSAYLQNQPQDKANGFYPRSLPVGSVPVEMEVARTRSGQFRRPSLPLAISVAIARKLSRCFWACSVAADRSRLSARRCAKWVCPARNKS